MARSSEVGPSSLLLTRRLLYASVVFFFIVVSSLSTDPVLCNNSKNRDKVSELLKRQARSPDGVIRFDDASVREFVVEENTNRRGFTLVIFFDAAQLRDNSELKLEHLRREFGLLSSSYIHNSNAEEGTSTSPSKLFFVDLDFKQSQQSFALFGVSSLPRISVLLPGVALKDADPMDQSDIGRAAEGMAAFVESRTKIKVGPIKRPPPINKKQLFLLVAGFLAVTPFAIKQLLAGNTPAHNPKVWAAFALFVYFYSVSGGMHNIIRGMPLFMADRNNPGKLVFFYQASGTQLGAEGFVVGSLYMVLGLMMGFVTHFLVMIKNTTTQRVFMLICMVVGFLAVQRVIYLDNWKTGYRVHGYWPNRWR